ncbi:MAG: amidinotransferase [Sphingobacteriia bacterium]|nr:amidinotransferase [Sphingobacteriia bacterium]
MKKSLLITSFIIVSNVIFSPLSIADTTYGGQTMVGSLKKVLVRKPDLSFGNVDSVKWHYTSKPILDEAIKEHNDFVEILKSEGVEVIYHNQILENHADAIFVHDPAVITDYGAIILRMGKELRRGEEEAMKKKFIELNIPILYELKGTATAEGGDILWLDDKTLAIGRGFRTNQEGINQIKDAVKPYGIEVVQIELPYDQGKEACLHLQSLISLIDHKKALVYSKLLPVSFIEILEQKGFELIEVPEEEFAKMGPNVLAIKPNVCLTIEGNVITKARLEQAGCKVHIYKGNEISKKAEGGATCLTRPILREM